MDVGGDEDHNVRQTSGTLRTGTVVSHGRFRVAFGRLLAIISYAVVVYLLWLGFVTVFGISSFVFPGPNEVWGAAAAHWDLLLWNTLYTIQEAVYGFALATLLGVLLAIGLVTFPVAAKVILPTLAAVNAAPKLVVAPIFIIWLGLGMASKIGMALLLSFFPIVIATAQGLSEVSPDLLNLYRLMRANRRTMIWRVRLPHAVPYLFSGMKIGLPLAVIGAVIGEFVAARRGIGHHIMLAYSSFDPALVFAGVIAVTVASVLLFQLVEVVETRVLRWRPN